MKNVKRLIGLLLCLAMVLSFVPANIISTIVKAATTTTDILEKINLTDTVIGGCSQNGASVSDIQDLIWYNKTAGHETWSKHKLVADGSASSASTFNCGGSERADWYLDLSGNTNGYTTVDQFILYAGGTTSVPTIQVTFILEDGTEWEETFTTGWNSADDKLSYTLDETINATGMYVWQPQNTTACLGEIELYHYIQIEALETAKINGVDLSQYKIVYSASDLDYAKTAAEYIQKQILLKTGRQVDVVTDATAETTYEILVGNTNRTYSKSISAPSEITTKFTFASNGTKIAMKADYFVIAGAAYYFVETYIDDTNFDVTVNTGVTVQKTITKPAKNFIMLIGDGMGVSQTEMFEYYDITDPSQYDPKYNMSDGESIFYGYYFPYEGRSRTWNVLNEITDSGAGGTALATGYKTYNQHIGQNSTQIGTAQVYDEGAWQTVPVCQEVENLTELALRLGKSAAVMSTEETWGATPSSFSAHMYNRYKYEEIWADQNELRNQGVIFVDHDRYLDQFTAAEWEDAKPYYKAALEQIAQDPDGFFMMYEEAYIDKECHNNRPDLSYMTMVRFNQAIAMFMEFAMYNPETLVLITADHETGGLAATSNGLECTEPNPNSSGFNHTLMEVPVFAYGEGADAFATNIVDPHDYYSQYNGWYHNTSIARTFASMMGDSNFGDPQFPILTSSSEPEDPNAVVLAPVTGLATPEFGYYTNGTSGAITPYYQSGREPANLIDGSSSTQTRSDYYLHSDITSGAKTPVILFNLGQATVMGGIKIEGYEYQRYNIEDFEVQVSTTEGTDTWVTAATVNDAFRNGTNGNDVTPMMITFDQTYTAYKVRILVKGISDMSAEAGESADDAELLEGGYIRLKEITLYYDKNGTPGETPDPDQPATQAPTQAPTTPAVGTMQKIDLTGTVVGVDSQNSATESDFTKFTWYSTLNPNWKDITIPVNGNYDDEIHWGLDPHERGDIYLDLTRINASGVAASQLKLYHSKYRDVPSLTVILKLADGSFVEKTFTLNWKQDVAAEPFVYTFDETYQVAGVYLWENQSNEALRATFGEIEMFYKVGDEPATPPATQPTTPPATESTQPATQPSGVVLTPVAGLAAPEFGYYTNGTTGTITPYYQSGREPQYLIDGDSSTQTRSEQYAYSDVTGGIKVPVILFNLGEATTLGGVAIEGYEVRRYNMENFQIQVSTTEGTDTWTTVATVTDAFRNGNKGDDIAEPLMVEFTPVTAYKVRILVNKITDMTEDMDPNDSDYAELSAGGYMRVREVTLYETVGGSTEPTTPPATEPTTPPATQPTTPPATQPTTPPATEPVVGTGLKVVSPTKLSTVFGCYTDGTGADESTFSDGNDGYCVTDGWFGRAGYSERTSAQGKIALIMTLSETKTLGGIEITGNGTSYDPVDFDVQAYVDGQWVTVYSQDTNAFTSSIRTVMCEFDQTVTTNKVRVLVNTVSGGVNSQCRLQEVVLFETSDKAYANIDLTGKGSSTDANAANPIGNLVDNSKDSIFLGSNATFNLGTATKIDGFRLFNYRGNQTYPSNVTVEVQLTAGGEYTNIGTFATGWSSSYPLPIMEVEFGQTYEVYGIRFNFGAWAYINGLEVYQYVEAPAEPEQPDTIIVGSSYNVHLIEPWALRVKVQFAKNTQDNLIPVSNFTDYGAYAIIGNKFEGTTAEELMADTDAVKYTKAADNITAEGTTLTFDFYDGLYSYNLGESVHWVAYFVTADGTYYTSVQTKSLTDVADSLLGKEDVSDTEKAVLQSMKDLKDAVIALRGEDANLGNVYAPGTANTGLGDRNTGYQFGTSSQIKLIEPWGVRVRVLMRDKTAAAGVYADYENADDYGVIFFHDKTGKYNGTMTAAQMSAETGAKVFSKQAGNAAIVANGVTAVYDQGIYTYDLDTNLYCLPYIVVDGEYYYPANATCWNLLGEMTEYSQDTDLTEEERAVFSTMLEMYENVQNHIG